MKRNSVMCIGALCLLGASGVKSQTAADSGWVNLFNGTNLNGLYVYAKAATNGQAGYGRVTIPKDSTSVRIAGAANQPMFKVDTGKTISVGGTPNGYIGTVLQYSYYHVRVEFQWPVGTAAAANAGLLINLDSASLLSSSYNTTNNRPCSIEVNMKRDGNYGGDPFTLWSAQNLGPYITTNVVDSNAWLYTPTGGIVWTDNPFGNRTVYSSIQNPEKPLGQWNLGEAYMYGADSGVFILNGVVRTRGRNFQVRANSANPYPRIAYNKGNIGLQSEGYALHYRNFQIQKLDSATGKVVALLNRERNLKLSGKELLVNGFGERWIDVPREYSGAELFNLQGRKVWSYHGSGPRIQVPASVETGVLRVRLLP